MDLVRLTQSFIKRIEVWLGSPLVGGAAVSLGFRVIGALLGFAFNILVTHSLGIKYAGYFFLAIATMNILPIVARLGVDTVATRYMAVSHHVKDIAYVRGIANLSFAIVAMGSLVLSVTLWFSSPYIGHVWFDSQEIIPLLQISALAVLPIALQKVFSDLLLVTQRVWASQLVQMLLPQLMNLSAFYFLALTFGIEGGIWAIVIAAYITFFIAAILWWQSPETRRGGSRFPDLSQFLNSCWAATGVAVAGLGISAISPVVLGAYGSKEEVAMFSVALRVAMLANFVAYAIQNASIRKFSILYSTKAHEELQKSVKGARRLSAFLCSCLLIPVIIFSEPIMGIFGDEFRLGNDILVMLCVGQLLIGLVGPVMPLLLMSGNERTVRDCTMVAAAINVPLHFLLVPIWGGIGAAFSYSMTFFGATVAMAIIAKQRRVS